MTESQPIQNMEKLVVGIYSQAYGILEGRRRFYRPDGIIVKAESFFCEEKDTRGSSDIAIEMDVTEGMDGPIKIKFVRNLRNERSLIRELTVSKTGIENLTIKERKHHASHHSIITLYSGNYDQSRLSLEAVSRWISEAKVNLETGIVDPPCVDTVNPRLISLSPRLIDRLNGKSSTNNGKGKR